VEEEKIYSDGECVSFVDSDKVLARLKEHCSDQNEGFDPDLPRRFT
jgi:hypothetical protein